MQIVLVQAVLISFAGQDRLVLRLPERINFNNIQIKNDEGDCMYAGRILNSDEI